MTSNEIRKRFLEFFAARGHRVVPSSSLVPANDPTLLFTNAGMNQFKDVFLGREKRDYLRACSSQKCVRAGGKHNDLEQVGRTTRHHTFFEMLGNFSFGDYFKKEAIPWAWELMTRGFGISPEKLYVTVFEQSEVSPGQVLGGDHESLMYWSNLDIPAPRIRLLGAETNFWAMGETGPCGPCSEIHYDLGPAASELGHKDCGFPCDCGRYTELWNLVFMQFNRDESGNLIPLPRPSIDTGAGLERLAAVLQGEISNFDTDLFRPLIDEAASLANVEYSSNHDTDVSLRIIADHSRAATFLISDGLVPSNEGRGYVLRKIMRRAILHGRKLGLEEPFLYKMAGHVAQMMKGSYPELVESEPRLAKMVKGEETRFARTLSEGLARLEDDITNTVLRAHRPRPGDSLVRSGPLRRSERADLHRRISEIKQRGDRVVYPGESAFKLFDTFGLPLDFIQDAVRNFGLELDQAEFDRAMAEQRERARASWKGAAKKTAPPAYQELAEKEKTAFDGYAQTHSVGCRIVALVAGGKAVSDAKPGDQVEIILDHGPFYAEAGGQVGDTGHLFAPGSTHELAHINDTYAPVSGLIAHKATVKDTIRVGDVVTAQVDAERRNAIRRNHTATHLLHAALRKTLGTHVKQAGSLVAPDRLRFDFTHYASLDPQDVLDIEDLVNEHVLANEEVHTEVTDLDRAIASGAMALFGEKYGDLVRVVSITDFSKELCGGTHVCRTGDIGLFKVVSEASVAAGTRRIEALTGQGVVEYLRSASQTLSQLAEALRARPGELVQAAEKLSESERRLRKQLESQRLKRAVGQSGDLLAGVKEVKGVRVVSARVDVTDRAAMRQIVDGLRAKLGSGVIVLGSVSDGKAALIVAVTKDLTDRLDAGRIVREAAVLVEGTGGGRKDLAEAGGKNPGKLDQSLECIPSILEKML